MSAPAAPLLAPLRFDEWPTRHLFFTGKGGVGKTTVAAATAVALADKGQRTLLVSTDPASNLDDLFGISIGGEPTGVGVEHLQVVNIDPEAAAAAYRERMIGPYRGVLPDAALRSMEEQLSGACTVEIAAFNEFTGLLTSSTVAERYDRVVFDTAPTGHTLRLLTLPSAWTGFVDENPGGAGCLGPLAGLEAHKQAYAAAVATLTNAAETTVVLVSRPEQSALAEAARAAGELAALGVANQRLVLNGVFADDPTSDPVAAALADRQAAALAAIPAELRTLDTAAVSLQASQMIGVSALRALALGSDPHPPTRAGHAGAPGLPPLPALVEQLAAAGSGVVMTMGKGGVGKTTIAAALAVALADAGCNVELSTTDPAAHLEATLAGYDEQLTVSRIDPAVETARYSREVIEAAGELNPQDLALLEEDLRSPCTEEIAVFRAFARIVDQAKDRLVVLDTAPTGHTLLLLDATQSYQRDVERTNGDVPEGVRRLLERLRDPAYARMLLVTLAESTPVDEAARLQQDLRRAGIEPYGWVINASLSATGTSHALLAARAGAEAGHIRRVADQLAQRTWLVPWQPAPPVGSAALRTLACLPPAEAA